MAHPFDRFDRPGADPVGLPARHPAVPLSRETASRLTSAQSSHDIDPPLATATPIASPSMSVFKVGDRVELHGLQSAGLNGAMAIVEQDSVVSGGRLRVRLETKQPGKLTSVKPQHLKKWRAQLHPGQLVALVGLKNSDVNGLQGVVESCSFGARVMVRLYEGKVISVKPENLEILADIID